MDDTDRKYFEIRGMVDILCAKIENRDIDISTVEDEIAKIRSTAVEYFPDKENLFDMIYETRIRYLTNRCLIETGNDD
jgi:hypothetical protein